MVVVVGGGIAIICSYKLQVQVSYYRFEIDLGPGPELDNTFLPLHLLPPHLHQHSLKHWRAQLLEDFGCHFVFEDKNYERLSEILDHNLGMRLDNHTYNNIHILGLIVYREMKIIKF